MKNLIAILALLVFSASSLQAITFFNQSNKEVIFSINLKDDNNHEIGLAGLHDPERRDGIR